MDDYLVAFGKVLNVPRSDPDALVIILNLISMLISIVVSSSSASPSYHTSFFISFQYYAYSDIFSVYSYFLFISFLLLIIY